MFVRTPSRLGLIATARRKLSQSVQPIAQLQVTLPHAGDRPEMIGVQFHGLTTVVNRLDISAQAVEGDGPLVPSLGEARRVQDQVTGPADRLVVLGPQVQPHDRVQMPLVRLAAGPTPNRPQAGLGQHPHAAIIVESANPRAVLPS